MKYDTNIKKSFIKIVKIFDNVVNGDSACTSREPVFYIPLLGTMPKNTHWDVVLSWISIISAFAS